MKKITKEDIQKFIREETIKVLKEGMPVGAASLKPGGPVNIFQDGRFNMDVVVNGRPEAITGQLDEDSVDVLIELGAISQGGTVDQALGLAPRSRPRMGTLKPPRSELDSLE